MAAPVPMPHAHAVLRQLWERGLRLGVVTNGWPEVQTACLEGCGLMARVDDVVISRAVDLSKPDPAIYRLALQQLGGMLPTPCLWATHRATTSWGRRRWHCGRLSYPPDTH